MSSGEEGILLLKRIRALVEPVFGARLRGVVLYGSMSRGDAREDSDVDVLVLLDEPIQLGEDLRAIVHATYPLQLEIDRSIHAVPVSCRSYDAGSFALYRNAKREGVRL